MSQTEAPEVIDFEALLAPIEGDSPSGVDLREDPRVSRKYNDLRDLRKSEIDNERANQRFALMSPEDLQAALDALQSDPRRQPNWAAVNTKARELLCQSSKDLWVAAWLIEALVRQHGIAGLRDGFRLCRLLCEQYWDSIWPRPDEEDGISWTLAQLNGLNETLQRTIENIPIFRSEVLAPRERVLTMLSYSEAEKLDKLDAETRTAKMADGATALIDFKNAANSDKLSTDELMTHSATIASAIRELNEYYNIVSPLCSSSLNVSNIEASLAAYANRFELLTKHRLSVSSVQEGEGTAMTTDADQEVTGSTRGVTTLNKQVLTREDALEGLLKVADFFRRTEPHSPVSYALEQAVRWGRMPLPELLNDLVSSYDVRQEMFKRLGIQEPVDENSDN